MLRVRTKLFLSVATQLIICTILTSCFDAPGPIKSGNSTLRNALFQRPLVNQIESTAGSSESVSGPGIVALSVTLANELKLDLERAGLTSQQAVAISSKADSEARANILAIDLSTSMLLTEGSSVKSPLQVVLPLFVKGVTKALDDADVGLDQSLRRGTLGRIVSSTFRSINGRTTGLDQKDLSKLSADTVASAVRSLPEAEIGESEADNASKIITAGAVSSLTNLQAENKDLNLLVSAVVSTTVSTFAEITKNSKSIRAVALNASSGAIGAFSTDLIASESGLSLIEQVTKSSVSAIKQFSSDESLIHSVAGDVTASAVSALKDKEIKESSVLKEAIKSIAEGSCEGLKESGLSQAQIIAGAGAVAAGAMQGLAETLSHEQLADGGFAYAAISGTFESMASVPTISDELKVSLMTGVVERAVETLVTSNTIENTNALLAAVVSGSVTAMDTLGITKVDQVKSTIVSVTSAATTAISKADASSDIFVSAVSIITVAAVDSVTQVNQDKVSLSELASITASAVKSVNQATDELKKNNAITDEIAKSTQATSATAAQETLTDSEAVSKASEDQVAAIVNQVKQE